MKYELSTVTLREILVSKLYHADEEDAMMDDYAQMLERVRRAESKGVKNIHIGEAEMVVLEH